MNKRPPVKPMASPNWVEKTSDLVKQAVKAAIHAREDENRPIIAVDAGGDIASVSDNLPTSTDLIIYTSEDGQTNVRLRAEDGTVWLSQGQMAELFQSSKQNISFHVKNVLAERELPVEPTVKEYLTVQNEGGREVKRSITLYRLEVVLAVGYRVRSERGTQFRRWATSTLNEYLVKGFVMNDERLKEPGGWDYFDELLARIREIRASEKRFYQKVTDIFATSTDYDAGSDEAQKFFATIQNKMLWAVTGKTAAELIVARCDPSKFNAGLTTWQGGRVRKADVTVAKNYLQQDELDKLNRIVVMFLDTAELRAQSRKQTTMKDWREFVDGFLTFNEQPVLTNAGKYSHAYMERVAHERYAVFDDARKVAELEASEAEYEREVETQLQQLEKKVLAQAKPKKVKK